MIRVQYPLGMTTGRPGYLSAVNRRARGLVVAFFPTRVWVDECCAILDSLRVDFPVSSTEMSDDTHLRRRILLRLLGSPLVMSPFLMGSSLGLASWALNSRPGLGLFALLAGVLGAAGMFVTRLLLNGPEIRAAIQKELQHETLSARESALDDLDKRLANSDKDPRPEASLRDLRALRESFEQLARENLATNSFTVTEVLSQVRELHDRSARSLEQTIQLHQIAVRLTTPNARQPILEQRERLIEEVQATVKQLGNTLVAIQNLGTSPTAASGLSQLRAELDDSLKAAARAEARLESMLAPVSGDTVRS